MTVTVDSNQLSADQLGFVTFGDVLSHLQTQNRLVTQVLIDGRSPDLDAIGTLRTRPLLGHTVFIETTAPRQIALDVLDAVEQQMEEADAARAAAIDHLSAGEPNKALQKLSGCFTTWQAGQQAIQKVARLLRVDLERITAGDTTLAAALTAFAGHLRDIKTALESRDYVTLSDILTYEIDATIRSWREAFGQMRAIVA